MSNLLILQNNMDALYINDKLEQKVKSICSKELYDCVINKFQENHKIVRNLQQYGFWKINSFLDEDPELIKEKVKVILAFSFWGTTFMFDNPGDIDDSGDFDPFDFQNDIGWTFGEVNVLSYLADGNYIDINEWMEYFEFANNSHAHKDQPSFYFKLGSMNFESWEKCFLAQNNPTDMSITQKSKHMEKDKLLITQKVLHKMQNICEVAFLDKMLEEYKDKGNVLQETENENLWEIFLPYPKEGMVLHIDMLMVILSFSHCGGFVKVNDDTIFGSTNLICKLRDLHLISDEDFEFVVKFFADVVNGTHQKYSGC